jgi:membrane-associated protease RseP (regulator of RpoE activity)
LLYTLGVLFFAFGLLASIALHEVGHMVPAKAFGVKVTQYMVGFGPTMWSRKKGDTEYGIKWIPAGGYIRMIGMVPPSSTGKVSRWPRRMATAIEDFRRVSRAEVDPQDEHRQFYRLTPGKKMIVMLGGPCMNLLIYLVLTVVLLTTMGLPHDNATTQVATVVKCVYPANAPEAKQNDCAVANSPAAKAKLRPGDRIVSIGGTAITSWDQAVAIIEKSPGKPLAVVVDRKQSGTAHSALVRLTITPVENTKCANDACTAYKKAGFIGLSPRDHHYYSPIAITSVPGQIASQVRQGWDRLMQYPARVKDLWQSVFDNKPRDLNSAVGVVGIGRISGDFARSKALDTQDKVFTLVGLLASLNLLLFFFNLLPLLPLDGGHVAGALVEATRRGWSRLRGRGRTTVYVDTAQMLPVMYGVASVLIVLTLLTLYADIVKPVQVLGG